MRDEERPGKDIDLQKYLEEQFQKLQASKLAPEELKEEVFKTLDTLQLIADVTDLFTVKFTKTSSQAVDFLDDSKTPGQPGSEQDGNEDEHSKNDQP